MHHIELNIQGQSLSSYYTELRSDTIGYLTCGITASSDWDGMTISVIFRHGDVALEYIAIDGEITENMHLSLTHGIWHVSCVGTITEGGDVVRRITTGSAIVPVSRSGDNEDSVSLPSLAGSGDAVAYYDVDPIIARVEQEQTPAGSHHIELTINGQSLSVSHVELRADTIDYITCGITTSSDWDGMTICVKFKRGDVVKDIIAIGREITEDMHLNLSQGMWEVSCVGIRTNDGVIVQRITTGSEVIPVGKSNIIDGAPFIVSSSIGEQILAIAQSVRADADAGLFNGAQGPPGEAVVLPTALQNALGMVMGSGEDNKISVSQDGTMEVNSLNVNRLIQTEGDELILRGGGA